MATVPDEPSLLRAVLYEDAPELRRGLVAHLSSHGFSVSIVADFPLETRDWVAQLRPHVVVLYVALLPAREGTTVFACARDAARHAAW